MAHAQKPHFVFRRNGRVHLNRRRRQFSPMLAAEVCASAVVMLDTPRSEVVLPTPFASFPFHFPSRVSPCAIRFQTHSTQQALNERKVRSWEAMFKIKDNFCFKFTIQTQSDRWAAGDSIIVSSHNWYWYCSPNSNRATKRRRVSWIGHEESTPRIRYSKNILIRLYGGGRSLVRLDVDFQYIF